MAIRPRVRAAEQLLSNSKSANPSVLQTSLWSDLARVLRGKPYDCTSASLGRAVVLLAIPMTLEMAMEALFAIVHIFFVARLGRDAVAVVGLTEAVMSLIYAVALGVSITATAVVARRIGGKDVGGASLNAAQILLLSVAISAALGLALGCLAPQILAFMGANSAMTTVGVNYARLMFGCNVTVFLIFVINAIFRGAGDAALAMRTLWIANAVNVVLCPALISGWGPLPELGLAGAAVATNIGRGIGVLYQLWHLLGGRSLLRVRAHYFRPLLHLVKPLLANAMLGIGQLLINNIGWVLLYGILARFGSTALAGYTIAIRIVSFALLPGIGISNAAATLVGQNLGARMVERAERAATLALGFSVLLFVGIAVAFLSLAYPLVQLFTTDLDVADVGVRALWIVSLGLPFYAAAMCLEAAFNGAGDVSTPLRINFYCMWLGQVPLAWLLTNSFGMGPTGVFVAVPVSYVALAVYSGVVFIRGSWKVRTI